MEFFLKTFQDIELDFHNDIMDQLISDTDNSLLVILSVICYIILSSVASLIDQSLVRLEDMFKKLLGQSKYQSMCVSDWFFISW